MTATATRTALAGQPGSRVELPLPVEDETCGYVARKSIRLALTMWEIPDDLVGDVVLVFDEYLSNIKMHTDSRRALLIVCLFPDRIHIEVFDFGQPREPGSVPTLLEAKEDDEHLRGLDLVEKLASSWAWDKTESGLMREADFDLAA